MFQRKDVIIILWMTFLTVVAWIVFGIYHIWITSTISEIDASAIAPIQPKFDIDVINSLKNREAITPLYNFSGEAASSSASTSTPISSESAETEITPSPSPTEEVVLQLSGSP